MKTQVDSEKRVARTTRLRAEVSRLRERLERQDHELGDLRSLLEDRTRRLAGRLARLEAASAAVQCCDGS